jgi:acyl-coenzyme A synthetase/AMP-(fatty) acid ligase
MYQNALMSSDALHPPQRPGPEGPRPREEGAMADQAVTVDRSRSPAQLAPYKFLRRFHFVPELPKTATGKIQRLRLRHLADAPAAAATGTSR